MSDRSPSPLLPPPPGPPPGYGDGVAPAETNGFAIASIVSVFVVPLLGIVFGHIALSQINRAGARQGGRGLALAGLSIGYAVVVLIVVFVAAFIASGPG